MCGKAHYGTCLEPRFGGESEKDKGARPKKKSRKAPGLPDGEARLIPSASKAPGLLNGETPADAPRVMRPADQLPLSDRITALEQIVDELLAGKRARSEYMKAYMRDRRARG